MALRLNNIITFIYRVKYMSKSWHHDASRIALMTQFFSLSVASEGQACQDQTRIQIPGQIQYQHLKMTLRVVHVVQRRCSGSIWDILPEAQMSTVENPSGIPLYWLTGIVSMAYQNQYIWVVQSPLYSE